jgi:hypothetical protein
METTEENKEMNDYTARTFVASGKWHLEILNKNTTTDTQENQDYFITLIIYNKSFFRNMPSINADLVGTKKDIASSVPSLY